MLAERWGEIGPLNLRHGGEPLIGAEGETGEFLLDSAAFGGAGGFGETIGEGEKGFLFSFLGAETGFDEIDENPVGAGVALLREAANTGGGTQRQRYTLADRLS